MAKKVINLSDITGLQNFVFPDKKFFEKPKVDKPPNKTNDGGLIKHKDAYEAYIKWAGTPRELREPKTIKEFEKLWHLPNTYVYGNFTNRSDFQERRMKFFWSWMFDRFPDVIYAVYRRAITNSTADAKIFAEIVGKKLETDAPRSKMTPFVLVGVPQEKINNLFVPEGYEEAEVVDGDAASKQ